MYGGLALDHVQRGERAFLVVAHQARIDGRNRGEGPVRRHSSGNPACGGLLRKLP